MLACEHGEWARLSALALQAEPNRCSLCSVYHHHVASQRFTFPLVAHNVAVPRHLSTSSCQGIPDISVVHYCVDCVKLVSL